MVLATVLFWNGWFLSGLAFAWGMCFLDTVDGKLARCTLTSTKLGDVFDHGIDLVHPPFWYYAWFYGLGVVLAAPLAWALWVVIIGYVAGRLQEGLFIWRFGIEIHTWRPVDSWFRLITARRNPNMVILFVSMLFSRPDIGLIAVAWWTVISCAVHAVRLVQAMAVRHQPASASSPFPSVAKAPPENRAGQAALPQPIGRPSPCKAFRSFRRWQRLPSAGASPSHAAGAGALVVGAFGAAA